MATLRISTLLFFMVISVVCAAQGSEMTRRMDSLFKSRFPPDEPGCVVLISKHGKPVYRNAFGKADLELNVPMTTDMVFNLASITKQFTAVAILQLVESGKIRLQDSLQQYVPDYPSHGRTITIENLLTHTSGIKDYLQIDYSGLFMERWDFSPKQLIDSFKSRPLEFEPSTRFSYSNSGYYLLGYIIEKVSGERYQQYIRNHLLLPLGMTHSFFDSAGIIIPNRVRGYRKEGEEFRHEDFWSPTIEYSAGGLISNADDLLKWHTGLRSNRLLSAQSLNKATTSFRLRDGKEAGYGYGWFLRKSNGIRSIEHGGGIPGFTTNEVYFPDEDIFMVILTNCGTSPISDISIEAASIALEKSMQSEFAVEDGLLDRYTGVYQLAIDRKRTITISRNQGGLIAEVSKKDRYPIIFQSPTKFQFKNILGAECEFILNGQVVVRFDVEQNGHFQWLKIK
jgi:CubicO group peptidase (beta-lactamase class C family)